MSDWFKTTGKHGTINFNEDRFINELQSNFNYENGSIRVYYEYFLYIRLKPSGDFYIKHNIMAPEQEIKNWVNGMLREGAFNNHQYKGMDTVIVQISWKQDPYNIITNDIVSNKLRKIFIKYLGGEIGLIAKKRD